MYKSTVHSLSLIPSLLGVLSTGRWEHLKELENEELKRLASNIPSTILQAKVNSTTKKYLGVSEGGSSGWANIKS